MDRPVLGVDAGSVSVSLVKASPEGELLVHETAFHHGRVGKTLRELLSRISLEEVEAVVRTSSLPPLLKADRAWDTLSCFIAACRRLHPGAGSLLVVGGERFYLVHFTPEGRLKGIRSNSSCAAGMGSFLDQQALRLGLAGSGELAERALANRGPIPAIASRCSVFAKTDMIHSQQEGYTLEEICDGLCRGLARNIADTVLAGEKPPSPLVFAGGVARNAAVRRHLEEHLGIPMAADNLAHLYGALGACLLELQIGITSRDTAAADRDPESLFEPERPPRALFNPALIPKGDRYPDFFAHPRSLFHTRKILPSREVEVDLYHAPAAGGLEASGPAGGSPATGAPLPSRPVVLGVDVGSTSTKAVLLALEPAADAPATDAPETGAEAALLAGFYTRTAGLPLAATQALFEAILDLAGRQAVELRIAAVAFTGSGRRFAGEIVGADLILDEITAHARAARALYPEVDTIIEIGGQDAKFTTLRRGEVTFCAMNTVCSAGTGSFLEEQAQRLGVPLEEYSRRAEGVPSPLASDRCTVFMERDLNHFLSQGYGVEELLAACLFSVRENYLRKVAVEAAIGKSVCFQGATAKNRSLVAAFEERLGRPIFVSRACALTGALGAALAVREEIGGRSSRFRGLELFREEIPLRSESCDLCANRCRLHVAVVRGKPLAFGFKCGRDYDTRRFVKKKTGFDPLESWNRSFFVEDQERRARPILGIPAALHLTLELPFWKRFFAELGVAVITSEGLRESVGPGKEKAGAEFCAPLASWHGHVLNLLDRADGIFLPFYLSPRRLPDAAEAAGKRGRSSSLFCYYTQFAPSLACLAAPPSRRPDFLLPCISPERGRPRAVAELFRTLKPFLARQGRTLSRRRVNKAWRQAASWYDSCKRRLREDLRREMEGLKDIAVILLGRPYTLLSPELNKGIPEILASLGIRAFLPETLPVPAKARAEAAGLLQAFPWHHSARVLETAITAARIPGLYPVFLTSFKCSPDSFALESFKRLMEACGKPYLILQLDEHDAGLGYETRLEAGIRAFRNHFRKRESPALPAWPRSSNRAPAGSLQGRVLLLPAWDPFTSPLLAANLQREGIDARTLEETEERIRRAMRLNTGQCIPLSIIAQETIDYLKAHRLDPQRSALWMPRAGFSCNLPLYPFAIKGLLEAEGGGVELTEVYVGELSHREISLRASLGAYRAYLFGGLLRRLTCRLRPYALNAGDVDRAAARALAVFKNSLLGRCRAEEALEEVVDLFAGIPRQEESRRPKVAVFGDLYARDNEVLNQELIRAIEEAGGEVVPTPYTEYLKIVAGAYFRKWFREGRGFIWLVNRLLLSFSLRFERRLLGDPGTAQEPVSTLTGTFLEPPPFKPEILARFNVRIEHSGESLDNLLKVLHLKERYPDLALFVQASPAFCCPALVTEAMDREIERVTGVPVVTVTYDGTGGIKNDLIRPYLQAR